MLSLIFRLLESRFICEMQYFKMILAYDRYNGSLKSGDALKENLYIYLFLHLLMTALVGLHHLKFGAASKKAADSISHQSEIC